MSALATDIMRIFALALELDEHHFDPASTVTSPT
jgi:isopenicillin N synthase-like dioxygenase